MSIPRLQKLVLGVTGSISAYKAPYLVRELGRLGVETRVVMTPSAKKFVTPTVLANLSGHPVVTSPWQKELQHRRSWHVEMAGWADAMLIAPCSASTLGRLAHGIYDTAVTLVAASLRPEQPLLLAPAMDREMWEQPVVQGNLQSLRARVFGPATGELASGLSGTGRLWEPEQLARAAYLGQRPLALQGKRVLIGSGPTREPWDSVRYLSNYSTGRMGVALADQAAVNGATVTLVSGPGEIRPLPNVESVPVETALQMRDEMVKRLPTADMVIMAAAVADFAPVKSEGKLDRRTMAEASLPLQVNPDILRELGGRRGPGQTLVGFALETGEGLERAARKLEEKNCDLIVLNWADRPNSGFGGACNTVTLVRKDGALQLGELSKEDCAYKILQAVLS